MHAEIVHKDTIPREKILETLHNLRSIGTKAITWTGGGEPTAYPHFIEAQNLALGLGLDTSIITNGQLLTGARADALRKAKWVRVSVDYWDAASMSESRRVKPSWFDAVDKNLKAFSTDREGDLEINFIVTRENHAHVYDAAVWLKTCGVDNIRFSPVWMDNFSEYHESIKNEVLDQLQLAKSIESDVFKVYSSYKIDPNAKTRSCSKCWFQQITPVIGADQKVYACKDTSYTSNGCIGSIHDRAFSDLWFAPETKAWFDNFDAKKRCNGIQCAAESKNVFYNELLAAKDDNFV